MAEVGPSLDPTPTTLFYSSHMESMMQRRSEFASELEFKIECSKVHWSEVQTSDTQASDTQTSDTQTSQGGVVAEETSRKVLESLQKHPQWGKLFKTIGTKRLELGRMIAKGGQAEIFEAKWGGYDWYVAKVFNEGFSLRDLQSQWPLGMLNNQEQHCGGFRPSHGCSHIEGGTLLEDGRFAFVMPRAHGDLRTLIEHRMHLNNHQGPPFLFKEAVNIMLYIAKGVQELHKFNIVHRDLKASNILIHKKYSTHNADFPSHFGDIAAPYYNKIGIADFECSVGVVGTGFWRAPEILLALKNRCIKLELFTKQADVYSYGMTCYEILTGKLPFEDYPFEEACSKVLSGQMLILPNNMDKEIPMLLTNCWNLNPLKRPTFEEIIEKLQEIEFNHMNLL